MLTLSINLFGSYAQNWFWVYSVTGSSFVLRPSWFFVRLSLFLVLPSSFVALFYIGMESGGSSSLGLKNKGKKLTKPVVRGLL
ncbi:hypothetical protein ACS0TY_022733 [Phlomoides rotata]